MDPRGLVARVYARVYARSAMRKCTRQLTTLVWQLRRMLAYWTLLLPCGRRDMLQRMLDGGATHSVRGSRFCGWHGVSRGVCGGTACGLAEDSGALLSLPAECSSKAKSLLTPRSAGQASEVIRMSSEAPLCRVCCGRWCVVYCDLCSVLYVCL